MKHRTTGRRALALTAAGTIALSGLFVAGPAFAEDGADSEPFSASKLPDLFKEAEAAGIVAFGTDAAGNPVAHATDPSAEGVSNFSARINLDAEEVQPVAGTLETFAEGDVVGGQGYLPLDQDGGLYNCSIGFAAWSSAGDPAVLSAGHCAFDEANRPMVGSFLSLPSDQPAADGPDNTLPNPLVPLGVFEFAQFGSTGSTAGAPGDENATDISVIDVAAGINPLPLVTDWTTATTAYDSLANSGVEIRSVAAPAIGDVAKSGRTTGYTEAVIDGGDILNGWANIDGRWVQGFESNILAGRGDSGGAVIQGSAAVGLISGGTEATETEEQFTWAASLVTALPKTGGYTVALHIDEPIVTSPLEGADVEPGQLITGTAAGATEVTVSGYGADQTIPVSNGNFAFAGPTELGAETITITAVNGFNTSASTTLNVTVVPAPLVAPIITSPADGSTVTETVTAISGTGRPGATVTVWDSADNELGTTEVAQNGNWTVDELSFEYGTHRVVVTQAVGEETSPQATSLFAVIPVAPVITSIADGAEFPHDGGPSLLSGTGIDGATVTVTLKGAEPAKTTALVAAFAAASGSYTAVVENGTWSVPFGAALQPGSYTVIASQAIGQSISDPTGLSFAVLAAPVAGGGGAAPGDGGLAATGADMIVPITAAAIALAMLSGGLLLVARRRKLIEN